MTYEKGMSGSIDVNSSGTTTELKTDEGLKTRNEEYLVTEEQKDVTEDELEVTNNDNYRVRNENVKLYNR